MTTATLLGAFGTVDIKAEQCSSNIETTKLIQLERTVERTSVNNTEPVEINLDNFNGKIFEIGNLETDSNAETGILNLTKLTSGIALDIDKYSTNYYYNFLDSEGRYLWDSLDTLCMYYISGKTDIEAYNDVYLTDLVFSDTLTLEEESDIATLFIMSNPQYYFLEPIVYYSQRNSKYGIALQIYDKFSNGSDRYTATKELFSKVDTWLSKIEAETDYDRCIEIHDMIISNVEYNYDVIDDDGYLDMDKEEKCFTQSAYSVFNKKKTVCSGFAKAYEMMCNAFGIDTIMVSSENHTWNKVRLNDSWYNIDLTLDNEDDEGDDISYLFFARSDKAYAELYGAEEHTEEDFLTKYLPKCTLDTGSNWFYAKDLPEITKRTSFVNIKTVETTDNDTGESTYQVTMQCDTKGATIYYTTDGSVPSVASDKSEIYKGTFYTNDISKLSAIAVHDKEYDSQVVSTSKGKIYSVKYVLSGGTNYVKNPTIYQIKSTTKLSKATKEGYKFSGWYTDKSFDESTKVTKIAKGTTGKITLYAKWTPIEYTITFNKNGGKGEKYTKTCKYGTTYTVPKNKFTKKGYKFVGWNTKKDGTGTSYKSGSKIKNLASKSGKNITLYAQWEKVK
jgi:uncharacterized repeat protein (TIGR02543 family)